MTHYSYFVTAARGLEPLVQMELESFGAEEVKPTRGGVQCQGSLEIAYRCCLWSRYAGRVLLPLLDEVEVEDADRLYRAVVEQPWEEWFDVSATFAVDCQLQQSNLTHSRFAALRVKDAVVDHFRDQCGARPDVATQQPDWRLNARIYRNKLTLSLDLSGDSLHRRGYRLDGGIAPLKETLAAAILYRAGWPEIAAQGGGLVDPLCGSGTLVLEAALMAGDGAPGLLREYFGFLRWSGHDASPGQQLRAQARERWQQGMEKLPPLCGSDRQRQAIEIAQANAQRAGLAGRVTFVCRSLEQLGEADLPAASGLFVTNPPYGERLGEREALRPLYVLLGEQLRRHFVGWKAAIFTGAPELGPEIGLRAVRKHQFFNGALPCQLLHFDIQPQTFFRTPVSASHGLAPVEDLSDAAQMFRNRLQKNLKQRRRWVKREQLDCYRVYDADLPEYAVAIDLYGDQVHVQEYQAPATVDERLARRRLREVVTVLPQVLGVDEQAVQVKVRSRQRGAAQYERQAELGHFFTVSEQGLRFRVNLTDYLDTGLFLDHRLVRQRVRSLAAGHDVLNLFAYTGSATVYAAAGGARSTTTVDMSATYLAWAQENLRLNGFEGAQHRLVQADCLAWLEQAQQETMRYGLIFLDPPSFSNSKRMTQTFDVQRDHVVLLKQAAGLLTQGGVLLFSNNLRRFRMDIPAVEALGLAVEDISAKTLPEDFARNPRIHNCWLLSRRS
ncbi:MAG: bifunctional 23S rRNA (guanine(2069)-N(7))-methyltransferase RlmK/23S rRNA (guanine(2445)-N(2))-methyltransferase RlmL [Desulfuromonadaceae bacterium]|nr:bifunctional 23S rRNA (guanine(2069)-N(7))-methyltransferase RlmK/23S rRNA (guanine(2445)-N(2))-methyltransferase RlmL [Desulfuromonadaceae bacterium]